MESEYIAHLLHLLVPGKTHRQDMVSPHRLVQVRIAKALIHERVDTCERPYVG